MSLHIRNARVVDAADNSERVIDIYLQSGKIVGLGSAPNGFRAEQTIDAQNRLVLPGLIDCQARLRDPGEPEKANIESETILMDDILEKLSTEPQGDDDDNVLRTTDDEVETLDERAHELERGRESLSEAVGQARLEVATIEGEIATAKEIVVAAYAHPTSSDRQFKPRRALGRKNNRATAATPARVQATCVPVKVVIFTAAPPVEKSSAAASTINRSAVRGEVCSVIDGNHTAH